MLREAIVQRVVTVLMESMLDYHEDQAGNLVEFQNLQLQHSTGRDLDGYLSIDCWPRIKTPEGLGPLANTWLLSSDFWELWDKPPTLTWITETPTFIQICGVIDSTNVTINLWTQRQRDESLGE